MEQTLHNDILTVDSGLSAAWSVCGFGQAVIHFSISCSLHYVSCHYIPYKTFLETIAHGFRSHHSSLDCTNSSNLKIISSDSSFKNFKGAAHTR